MTCGRFAPGVKPPCGITEQMQQLVADDLDDLLARRQARLHRLVVGAVADPIDEGLDDLQVDVGFEQRRADVAAARARSSRA